MPSPKPKPYVSPELSPADKVAVKRYLIQKMDECPVGDYETWNAMNQFYWSLVDGKGEEWHPVGSALRRDL